MSAKRVLFCVLALAAQSLAQTTKPVDCAKLDLSAYDKKCCSTPMTQLLSNNALKVCNPKNDKNLNKWVNEYMLNKIQAAKKGNAVDLTSAANIKLLCKPAAFINCIMTNYKIMSLDGTWYNWTNALPLVVEGKNDFWKEAVGSVVSDDGALSLMSTTFNATIPCPPAKRGSPNVNTFIGALFLTQYLNMYTSIACADPVESNSKNKCDAQAETFWTCFSAIEESLIYQMGPAASISPKMQALMQKVRSLRAKAGSKKN